MRTSAPRSVPACAVLVNYCLSCMMSLLDGFSYINVSCWLTNTIVEIGDTHGYLSTHISVQLTISAYIILKQNQTKVAS